MHHFIHHEQTPERRVLHSWKEIATYTGRGVRTLQRYEAQYGFPVRRPAGGPRSAVLALSGEIDQWLAKSPKRTEPTPQSFHTGNGQAASVSMCEKINAVRHRSELVKERVDDTYKRLETAKTLCAELSATWNRTVELQQRIRLQLRSAKTPRSGIKAA
jgi:predicted DNA-binding transcriptional regulator AlpA